MEVQLTDFENAAFTVFIALVSRALLYFNLNFYVPLSAVDENLKRAHARNAVCEQKFFWRRHIKVCPNAATADSNSQATESDPDAFEELSIRDIMLGNAEGLAGGQPGLINLVRTYLDLIECDALTRRIVDEYLDLISKRASGELMTAATWLRKLVSVHPAYGRNSLLNDEIVHDIVETAGQIVQGKLQVPQLLGPYSNRPRERYEGDLEQPARELKGAHGCASAAAATNTTVAAPSAAVLDLDDRHCCEKLRVLLAPYLAQANSAPSTPKQQRSTSASSSSSAASNNSGVTTPIIPWVSPSPQ